MTFTLVEREKLVGPAYRNEETLWHSGPGEPLEVGLEEMREEFAKYPRRYGPHGTHRLVLLSDGGQRR